MKKVIVAYVPVLHQGYRKFFEKYATEGVLSLYVIPDELLVRFDELRKDIRRLSAHDAATAVNAWKIFPEVGLADEPRLENLRGVNVPVVMPDDDLSRTFAAEHLPQNYVMFDASIFLRWDRTKVLAERVVEANRQVSHEAFDREVIAMCFRQAERATNLWRQVAGAIVLNGKVLLIAENRQLPSPQTPYYEGDARSFFKQGLHIELTTDEHAEARLIGEAARQGIALSGASLYLTTFPCPPCAKLVGTAGICRLYFAEGYAMLDGERVLRDSNIELIRVEMK